MKGQIKKMNVLFTAMLISVSLAGCVEKDLYNPEPNPDEGKVTLENYFDYSTRKTVALAVSYETNASKVYFEVYAENPLLYQEEGSQVIKRTDVMTIGGGFTDADGKYEASAVIPAAVTEVYIYSPDFGVPMLYKTQVEGGKINANINFENQLDVTATDSKARGIQSRGNNPISKVFPNTLGTWSNNNGTPNYLDGEKKIDVDSKLQSYITTFFPENRNNNSTYVVEDADVLITEDADVWINYFGGKTSAKSTFAYYCYRDGATFDEIKEASKHACVIFPNAHSDALGAYSGVAVRLKYITPDGAPQDYTDYGFPAGTKIGFVIYNNGWKGGNSGDYNNDLFYSTKSLNRDGISHTAGFAAQDLNGHGHNVITMEDWTGWNTVEPDYNDVAFVISSNPRAAIVLPPLPDPGETRQGQIDYRGLLGYEDNWPEQGDYDMNDVVVKYESSVFYNTDNKVMNVLDKFTLTWTGANLRNGFAYEFPYDLSDADVVVSGGSNWSKSGNVIRLFTDAKSELGVSNILAADMPSMDIVEKTYTVSVQFKDRTIGKDDLLPPYNPFIFRGKREVHLTDYAPTANADNVFPSGKDISTGDGKYYICEDGFPFAIHMDARADKSMLDLNLKQEAVRIDNVYSGFAEWAKTRNPNVKWW